MTPQQVEAIRSLVSTRTRQITNNGWLGVVLTTRCADGESVAIIHPDGRTEWIGE